MSPSLAKKIRPTGPICLIGLVCLLGSATHLAADPAPRPNFVLIVADDLGYGDLGCYGSETVETPHIDALASSGMLFTDFHTAGAMCSPTRASLLTGRYPQRFGSIFDAALSGRTQRHLGLPSAAVTVAERLREQGYATACLGKWHLGYEAPHLPNGQGFDVFRGLHSGDGDFHTQVDRSGNEDWWHDERPVREEGYTTELLTDHGIEFIEANRDRPFFLYLPHLAIHFPWQGPDDPPQREAGKSWHRDKWGVIPDPGNVAPHVEAMIKSLDAGVGRILSALRHHGLERNTLVVFTSDNGGYLTYGKNFRNISSNGPYRGQKMDLYEGGHRVPLIASWPGRIEGGAVTGETAHSNDLAPTFLELAGIDPDEVESDGADLAPLLFENKALPERKLFWRTRSHRAVRSGPWKLVADIGARADQAELYHLGNDPGETQDLSAEKPGRVAELNRAWQSWNARMEKP